MKIARPILTWLLFTGLTSRIFAEGFTYPNLSVSPFAPSFRGIGLVQGYKNSEATGVAATGGALFSISAIAASPQGPNFIGTQACFYNPGTGDLVVLPSDVSSDAFAVSGSGATKVGSSGGAHFWTNANGNVGQALDGSRSRALGISFDGLTVVGGTSENVAALWSLPGGNKTVLGTLPGYDSSFAQGVTANGQIICGRAFNSRDAIAAGATDQTRAFRLVRGFPMQDLGPAPDFVESIAYGLSADGLRIVGESGAGDGGFVWSSEGGMKALQVPPGEIGGTVGYAISGDGNLIVGSGGFFSGAYVWDGTGSAIAEVRTLLLERRVPIGIWRLSRATGISQDGYTICGVGTNPAGQIEGWVARLPPILHPPIVTSPGTIVAPPGAVAFIEIKATRNPTGYSAKGLPKGFSIDKTSGRITGLWSLNENEPGFYTVTVTAQNADGSGTGSFTLILPPPEGFQRAIQGHTYLPYTKPPGETYFPTSFGFGLSGNGQVAVGYSGPNNDPRAYRFTAADGMTPLPVLDGALYHYGNPYAASADGRVIVGEATAPATKDGPGNRVAVRWNATSTSSRSGFSSPGARAVSEAAAAPDITVTSLGFIAGGTSSVAYGVSADGKVIVGYGSDYDPNVKGSGIRQAFRWTASDGMVGLGWLQGGIVNSSTALAVSADGSIIVGGSSSANGSEAFRWTATDGMTGLGLPSGASFGRATGVSADNSTIIGHNGFSNHNRAFRWTAAEGMTDLGFLPGDNVSEANAISADGSNIVGRSAVDFNPSRAFIWDKTNGMRDLKAVLVAGNPNLAGWTLRVALGLSADGTTVVGWGQNPSGDLEGFTAYLKVTPPQLLNISTRMRVQTGENVLIGGFIITGTDPKKVIIRGIGPSLSSFFSGALPDPTLELHQGNTKLASNNNWKEHEAEVIATTIPPAHDLESAIVMTLTPGNYTAILSDKNGASGVGVVEVYDLAQAANSRLANISSRGFVNTGDNIMIGGLIVGGGSGVGSGRVLIRAIGPSLSSAGVTGALQDPTLELFNGSGTSLATNDDWMTTQKAEIEATTIAPSNDRESAIVATLPGGNYTAVVRGKNNTVGVAVVEAYNLQ